MTAIVPIATQIAAEHVWWCRKRGMRPSVVLRAMGLPGRAGVTLETVRRAIVDWYVEQQRREPCRK